MFPLLVWIECHDCVLKWRTGLNINGFAWNNMKWIWFSQKMKKSRIYAIRCPQHWAYPWMTIRTHRDGLSLSIPQIPEQCHPFEVTTKQSRAGRISFLTIEEKVRRPQRNSRFVVVFSFCPDIHFDNDRPILTRLIHSGGVRDSV